jgi:ribonuclease HI
MLPTDASTWAGSSNRQGRISMELTAHVDGGKRGIGVVLRGLGETIRISKWIGRQDSNVAEYAALLEAEQAALNLNASKLHVFSDS